MKQPIVLIDLNFDRWAMPERKLVVGRLGGIVRYYDPTATSLERLTRILREIPGRTYPDPDGWLWIRLPSAKEAE